ncbi:MAG: hypothetical protein HRF43_19550 [Phycisphaerae bacterium]|jgi:hypothetical protein
MKSALIAFVCISVASLGAFVYLFTQQADLDNRVKSAEDRAAQSENKAQQATDLLRYIAKEATGQPTEDPAVLEQAIAKARADLLQDASLKAVVAAGDALGTALQKLYGQYRALSQQFAALTAERDDLKTRLEAANKAAQAAEKGFQDRIAELTAQYQKLEQDFTAAREGWDKAVADRDKRLAAATDTAGQTLAAIRKTVEDLQAQLAQRDARIRELRETLASFRPSADEFAAIQIADGSVVRTVPGERLAYISLGANDRIKPGMNFAVYSRHRGVPPDGKGKASLEVVQVFDTTSECKVTSTTAGEPILEGDIVANPVFDRNRQFNFVVAGNFDLDFDGRIDDPAGQEVARLIEAWGGKVVKTVDTRTDFVVLGAAPEVLRVGPVPDGAVAAEHAQEADTARKQFDAVVADAKSLGIPILTRTRFLHFIGRPVPKGAPEN